MTKHILESEQRNILQNFFASLDLQGKKVLAIIPDSTRSGPTGSFVRQFCELAGPACRQLDFLIALGTHPEMSEEKVGAFLGISKEEFGTKFKVANSPSPALRAPSPGGRGDHFPASPRPPGEGRG